MSRRKSGMILNDTNLVFNKNIIKSIYCDLSLYFYDDSLHYEKMPDGTVKCIEDEIPFELPEGWEWCKLRNICYMIAGKSKSKEEIKSESFDGCYPCYGGNGQRGYVDTYNYDGKYSIIGRQGALCGNVNIAEGRFYATEHAVVVTLYDNIDFYWNTFILEALNINQYATGAAQPGLSVANVLNILVPLPPYKEQLRIAETLTKSIEIIKRLDIDKTDLQTTIQLTKSKILDLAIRGKLVPQNPDDEPASVLLDRIRAEKEELIKQGKIKRDKKESVIFRGDDNSYYEKIGDTVTCIDEELPFELPDGWQWIRLGNISISIQYGLSNSAESQGSHRLLRITDIQNGRVCWDTVPFTTVDNPNAYLLKESDIVFARTGATVGKSFLIQEMPYDSVFASYLIRIRLSDYISPLFLYQFFNSQSYWEQITDKSVGVGQPNCNGTSLKELFIPIPPISEQKKIADSVQKYINILEDIEKSLS